MRRLMKRMAAALLAGACLLSLSACSLQESQPEAYEAEGISMDGTLVEDAMSESLILSAAQTLGGSKEQLVVNRDISLSQGDQGSASIYEKQLAARSELGELRSVDLNGATAYLLADGSYTVVIPVTFTKGQMNYLLNLNMATQEIQAGFASQATGTENATIGDMTKTGLVYAGVGMGNVFAVLVFISLIIYCFKFINAAGQKSESSKKSPAPAAPAAAAAPAPAADSAEDEEIAAVIAAAIAAAEDDEVAAVITAAVTAYGAETSSNGLVVRSIRRLPRGSRR